MIEWILFGIMVVLVICACLWIGREDVFDKNSWYYKENKK